MKLAHSRLILAGGVPSSGSTLLSTLLDGHPDIRCGPETSLFCHQALWCGGREALETLGGIVDSLDSAPGFIGWARPDAVMLGYYGHDMAGLKRMLRMAVTVDDLIDAFYGASPQQIVDKTPQNVYATDSFLRCNANTKAILTIRDGFAVIDSLVRRQIEPRIAAIMWALDANLIHALAKKYRGAGRLMVIQYEHLVEHTDDVLGEVCEFLGVAPEIEAMKTRRHSDRAEQDPTLRARPGNAASAWRLQPFAPVSSAALQPSKPDLDPDLAAFFGNLFCKDRAIAEFVTGGLGTPVYELCDYFGYRCDRRPLSLASTWTVVDSARVLSGFEAYYLNRATLVPHSYGRLARRIKRLPGRFRRGVQEGARLARAMWRSALGVWCWLKTDIWHGRQNRLQQQARRKGVSISGGGASSWIRLRELQAARYSRVRLPADEDYVVVGVIAFQGRHPILKIVIEEAMKYPADSGRLGLVLACSEPLDVAFAQSMRDVHRHIGIVVTENLPLGMKWQRAVDCARLATPAYVFITGSDDIVSVDYLRNNVEIMGDHSLGRIALVGPRVWYMVDLTSEAPDGRLLWWQVGYSAKVHSMPLGAGRIYPRWLMDQVDWQIFDCKRSKLLDDRGFELVSNKDGIVHVPTMDDGFVLSVKGSWAAMNSTDRILQAESIIAEPLDAATAERLQAKLDCTWVSVTALAC